MGHVPVEIATRQQHDAVVHAHAVDHEHATADATDVSLANVGREHIERV